MTSWNALWWNLFYKGRDTAAALSLCVFVSPAAVWLGHGPYPRHCLAVLSPDAAQNACLLLSSSARSSFLCGRHLRVGHDLMERFPWYTAVPFITKLQKKNGALLLFTPINIYLLQVPNQLLDDEYSSIWYTVKYCMSTVSTVSNTVVSHSIVKCGTVQYRIVQNSSTVVQYLLQYSTVTPEQNEGSCLSKRLY